MKSSTEHPLSLSLSNQVVKFAHSISTSRRWCKAQIVAMGENPQQEEQGNLIANLYSAPLGTIILNCSLLFVWLSKDISLAIRIPIGSQLKQFNTEAQRITITVGTSCRQIVHNWIVEGQRNSSASSQLSLRRMWATAHVQIALSLPDNGPPLYRPTIS